MRSAEELLDFPIFSHLILSTKPGDQDNYYYPPLIDEETVSEGRCHFPKQIGNEQVNLTPFPALPPWHAQSRHKEFALRVLRSDKQAFHF